MSIHGDTVDPKGPSSYQPRWLIAFERERARWHSDDRSVRRVHWARFALVIVALMDAAAHLFASPSKYPDDTLWLEGEVALYILIAVIYLFGMRMWYVPALLYTVLNMVLYFVSGFVAIPGITPVALSGHLEFAQYYFGRGLSVGSWVFLLVVGILMVRFDPGSKINALLRDS